eukprot:TRINITY_DN2098_c0_g3_i1.p1 TRINITY_DN2098_c0_g3~~TRINITY_DN2098_c0_g3_i1.p1  ORF type:complete len:657 (-),score=121.64 TRINITY_DN2098_c0_g3_i1:81-2051(-)
MSGWHQTPGGASSSGAGPSCFKSRTTSTTREFLTSDKFAALPICSLTKDALLKEMRYETMTKVQAMTIYPCLERHDVLAKAKTGTGKTLAFLIPTIERTVETYSGDTKPEGKYLSSIILSPTRELAQQIYDEAVALTSFWGSEYQIDIVYGGIDIKKDNSKLNTRKPIDLLVGTPGRLLDHLQKNSHGILSERITPWFYGDVSRSKNPDLNFTLVFDEADQLLEMGFRDTIKDILSYLPTRRQTLLFSATIPKSIRDVATIALKRDHKFIDCVGDDEPTVTTVKQSYVVLDRFEDMLDSFFALLANILTGQNSNNGAAPKVVCFFVTARQTQYMAEVAQAFFPKILSGKQRPDVLEIHSRKSQAQRNKANDAFREAGGVGGKPSVLFSSDVSARGMDYPNVSHVIQLGMPSSREQYLHRLGRTARAGESGQGILMLHDFEVKNVIKNLLSDLDGLQKRQKTSLSDDSGTYDLLEEAAYAVSEQTREQCYGAWLGYYNGLCPKRIAWSKPQLVEQANLYADVVLKFHDSPPEMQAKTVGKMGLKGVPGLNIEGHGGGGGGNKQVNSNKGGKNGKKGGGKGGNQGGNNQNGGGNNKGGNQGNNQGGGKNGGGNKGGGKKGNGKKGKGGGDNRKRTRDDAQGDYEPQSKKRHTDNIYRY